MRKDVLPSVDAHGRGSGSLLGLYLAAFLFSLQDSGVLLALPWRVMGLGGQVMAVGMAGALSLGTYTVFCLLVRSVAGRIGLKRLVIGGNVVTAMVLALMPLTPRVGLLLGLVAIKGMVMSSFWPQIMGWVSTGSDGGALNRRLGFFNLSWCSGCILGTWLGGTLFNIAYWLPFAVGVGASVLVVVSVSLVPSPKKRSGSVVAEVREESLSAQLEAFRWIGRFALFFGWIGYGMIRVVIASLIKDMSLGASLHATLGATMNLIMVICFFLLGRWVIWHYRFWPLLAAQVVFAVCLVGVGASQTSAQLMICALAGTPILAFIYSSHLFYCVSGGRQRERNAALHEILLAAGFAVGSLGGGALGQLYGVRAVYGIIAGVIAAALLLQIGVFVRYYWGRSPAASPVNA